MRTPVLVNGERRIVHNFDPPMVLLVTDGAESQAKKGESLYRVVPASYCDEYPVKQLDVDQIKVRLKAGREIILHLDLNYPFSGDQLGDYQGEVNADDHGKVKVGITAALKGIPLMPADGAGLGPSEDMAEVVALERERIVERSESLPGYADFRRALIHYEWEMAKEAAARSLKQNSPRTNPPQLSTRKRR